MPSVTATAPAALAKPRSELSRKKKIAFSLIVLSVFFLLAEGGARVASYFYYGRNPYYLLYGFRSWTNDEGEGHSEKLDGYFKFPPDRTIHYGTPPKPSRINNHGFRGPDFTAEKAPGTFRIVCLGASSTFGYMDLDDETYPHYLAGLLGEQVGERRVEVLNCGIPHFTTDNIAAALEHEILGYGPDLLTLYTACADSMRPLAEGGLQRTCRILDEYSAAYAGVRKVVNAFGGRLFGQWTDYLADMDRAALERQLALHEARTRENLERIIALARGRGIPMVFIRQPITAWFDRVNLKLIPESAPRPGYEEEYQELESRLASTGRIHGFEARLWVHHHLNAILDELAAKYGYPQVDNVALVSERPATLGSWVHLLPEGNRRLAEVLHPVVLAVVKSGERP